MPKLLIFDTGPIRELVCYQAAFQYGFHRLRDELLHVRDEGSYDACAHFVNSFEGRMTSASVAVELYRWIRRTEERGHGKLWRLVYEQFTYMKMNEEIVKLLEMDANLVTRFGPTDVSLFGLARRHSSQKPTILTMDRALYGECRKAGFSVCSVESVVRPEVPFA